MTRTVAWLSIVLGLAAVAALPGDALACGGCFAPVAAGTASNVNAHRMAVALGTTQTTLWDQIQYTGAPEEFAWVLPVAAGVEVQLADDRFFDSLEQLTKIQLTAPLRPAICPDPCAFGFGAGSRTATASDGGVGGVTVYHEGVVGPYETATIGSDDPMALVDWLTAHGYGVPSSITPTIQYYVEQHMSFAALRLRPGASVQQMQPVRVTTPGLNVSFPLRMVAAGVQDAVSLELYVFAEGRYETQNFPAEEVDREAITYDYPSGTFSYDAEFQAAIDRGEGRGWVTEYVEPLYGLPYVSDRSGTGGTPSAELVVVQASLPGITPTVTKLRTRLEPRFLDRDVVLQASSGALMDQNIYVPADRELNAPPPCPTTCLTTSGTAAGLPGGGTTTFGSGSCGVAGAGSAPLVPTLAFLAAAVTATLRRRRR